MQPRTPSPSHRAKRRWSTLAVAGALAGAATFGVAGLAAAGQDAPAEQRATSQSASSTKAGVKEYRRGPAPTADSVRAAEGSFAYETENVPRQADFGGGTIYYPVDSTSRRFGLVAVSPGYTGTQSTVAWYGEKLASNGFVVITIDTLDPLDQPPSRGDQLLAALDHVTQQSAIRDRVDPDRLAVAGHSMGGGGSLNAAQTRPALKAAVPLTPWHTDTTWEDVTTPTLIIGAQNDDISPVDTHAKPFYASLTNARERAYLELRGAGHDAPMYENETIGQYALAWLKRYVDNDTRYEQFLCPAPEPDDQISAYQDTCPGS